MKYIVRLHHCFSDATEYTFTSEEKRDKFLKNLPLFYIENPNFVSLDVRSDKDEKY